MTADRALRRGLEPKACNPDPGAEAYRHPFLGKPQRVW